MARILLQMLASMASRIFNKCVLAHVFMLYAPFFALSGDFVSFSRHEGFSLSLCPNSKPMCCGCRGVRVHLLCHSASTPTNHESAKKPKGLY